MQKYTFQANDMHFIIMQVLVLVLKSKEPIPHSVIPRLDSSKKYIDKHHQLKNFTLHAVGI